MAHDGPLSISIAPGRSPATRIITLSGLVTLTNLSTFQDELRAGEAPKLAILDMAQVPYMDSSGMGAVINYFVFCQRHQTKMVAAAVSPRVMQLFKMTKVDTVIPMAASVAEAEGLR